MEKEEILVNKNERIDDLGIGNLKLIQNPNYFCFGTDSVLLANFVQSNSCKNVILDLCSGSGVIPIIISHKKKCDKILGVELQTQMYDLFERNVEFNQLQDKVFCLHDDINNIKNIRKFVKETCNKEEVDIIVSNPPYKNIGTGVVNKDKVKYIARHEEKCKLEDIFLTSSKLIKEKGKLYLVHKPERLVDLLCIARKYKFEAKNMRFVIPRIGSKPSIVLIEYIKNGGNELKVLPPLIEYDEHGKYTNEFLDIYGLEKGENIHDKNQG